MKYKGIIIFGTMGSGKDTLAGMLVEQIPMSKIFKLGEDIRGFVDGVTEGDNNRALYQDYGQSVRKLLGEDSWNIHCNKKIKRDLNKYQILFPIIADGRQLNEFDYWDKQGFLTIGIHVMQEERIRRLFERDGAVDIDRMTHDTELQAQFVATQMANTRISNDLNLTALRSKAQAISESVKGYD